MDSLACLPHMKQLVFRLEVLPVRKWDTSRLPSLQPYEKLLTYAWSYFRVDFATTSLEVFHGSVLCEVPDQEGDEQRPGHYYEEWAPGHSGRMPSLFHKDVPHRQSCIGLLFPDTAANGCRKERRGDRRGTPAATKPQTCWCRPQRTLSYEHRPGSGSQLQDFHIEILNQNLLNLPLETVSRTRTFATRRLPRHHRRHSCTGRPDGPNEPALSRGPVLPRR